MFRWGAISVPFWARSASRARDTSVESRSDSVFSRAPWRTGAAYGRAALRFLPPFLRYGQWRFIGNSWDAALGATTELVERGYGGATGAGGGFGARAQVF